MAGNMKHNLIQAILVIGVCVFVCPSASQNVPNKPQCPSKCKPSWIKMLLLYSQQLGLKPNGTMCTFANQESLFPPCQGPSSANTNALTCQSKHNVAFDCCPQHCLVPITPCFPTPLVANYCIPSNLQPWMSTLMQLFMATG